MTKQTIKHKLKKYFHFKGNYLSPKGLLLQNLPKDVRSTRGKRVVSSSKFQNKTFMLNKHKKIILSVTNALKVTIIGTLYRYLAFVICIISVRVVIITTSSMVP